MVSREENLLRSLTETSWRFYAWVGLLSAVVLWGLYAYILQLRDGLIVTGMRDQYSWGLYITNFVFFIGISHAGTLISAILRVTNAGWRSPITRLAEGITVFALCIGAPMVIIDLGQPGRLLNLIQYGRIQSPILWDVLSVGTYLVGCILYFYLPLIPDLGLLAAKTELAGWRRRLYRTLSLGWTNSAQERQLLEKAITAMAVVIIPLAISVHTVVSWIFAMTLRPGWDSSIFGPYFVVGAIYSGSASVVLSMYVFRRIFRLQAYLQPIHFRNLGLLLLALTMLYLYFNINEYFTVAYKFTHSEKVLLEQLFFGDYAPYFWGVQTVGVLMPLLLLIAMPGMRRYELIHGEGTQHQGEIFIRGMALASGLVLVGAWAKRYLIIIPTLGSPYLPSQGLPSEYTRYQPTWVEWSITAAGFAGFLLIYTLVAKLFPIVSIWETRQAEPAEAKGEAQVPLTPKLWKPFPRIGVFLLAALLVGAGSAAAQERPQDRQAKVTELAIEWEALPPDEFNPGDAEEAPGERVDPERVYLFVQQIFGQPWFRSQHRADDHPSRPIAVTAFLRDQAGRPLGDQAVSFVLHTSFGELLLGRRPTDEEGKARLVVRDQRRGKFPIRVLYSGDDTYRTSNAETVVDFGSRPAPALPRQGVLISPYPTAAIGLPFLLFYGSCWVAFFYAFGYLVLWRMGQVRTGLRQADLPPATGAQPASGREK